MTRSILTHPDSLLSLAAAREILGGISAPTLHRLIRRGDLPLVKIGRRSLVRRSDLDALIERSVRRGEQG